MSVRVRVATVVIALAMLVALLGLAFSSPDAARDRSAAPVSAPARAWGSVRSWLRADARDEARVARPTPPDDLLETLGISAPCTDTPQGPRWSPSPVGHTPASVRIDNTCDDTLVLVWIDFEGREREYVRMRPGHYYEQPTFEGHEWLVRSVEHGSVVARFSGMDGDVVVPCADGTPARDHATTREETPLPSCPICSSRSTTEAAFTIENRCARSVQLVWRNFEGATRAYGRIEPGRARAQQSYAGHRWEVVDDDGAVVARHVVDQDGARVVACP